MSGLELIGALVSAGATVAGGVAEKRSSDFEADQLDAKAKEEAAASQREAAEATKEADVAMSRQQALAASSGGGAGSDAPTIVKLMSDVAGQGELNKQSILYGGQQRAAGLIDQAKGRRASGRASLMGSTLGAFGQAAKGVSSYAMGKGSFG